MLLCSRLRLILLVNVLTFSALADYGWLPDYQKLIVKGGFDFYQTSQNFDASGTLDDPTVNRAPTKLTDFRLWTEPEYGIAEDWAILGRLSFISCVVDNQNTDTTILSGAGLGDIKAGVKYGIKNSMPILTLESFVKIPVTAATVVASDEVVLGDGNFDLGLVLHTGHRTGKFTLALSPGLLVRFGGYSTAGIFEIAGQFNFQRGYVRAFANGIVSFTTTPLFDSNLNVHDAPGTGGSYARLNGSPLGIAAGGLIGLNIAKHWSLESRITHTVFGTRYPNYLEITANVVGTFDFYKPDKRKKVREIPLDSQEEKFY